MKTEFNDELKYVDLLLPTLKLLDNETKTENELIEILRNDRIYRVYNKQIITDELENTLDYLQKTDYINQDNINEYQITTIGSDLIENLYHEEDKIMKKDIKVGTIRDGIQTRAKMIKEATGVDFTIFNIGENKLFIILYLFVITARIVPKTSEHKNAKIMLNVEHSDIFQNSACLIKYNKFLKTSIGDGIKILFLINI